jgi:multidrug efflux pump subunit AcrA (membrane-fusion protein)
MKFPLYLLLLFAVSCAQKEEGIKPEKTTLTESVYASVRVEPDNLYEVYAAVPGILDTLYVGEGDRVNQGQIIARVYSETSEIAQDNAQLNMELAASRYKGQATLLGSIEREIELIKAQVRIDSLNYIRQQNLWNQNIGSQSEFENKKLKYEQGMKQLDLLEREYVQTQVELQNQYRLSKNAVDEAKLKLKDFTIESRLNGMVYEILKKAGEFISAQTPILLIGDDSAYILKLQVDEVDIARVRPDQEIILNLDAYPRQTFKASVSKIFPSKNMRSQTFEVEARFLDEPPVLYSGLSGEANIVLETRENVLTIPAEYVFDNNKVRTAEGEISVELGIKTLERVEILSGIDSSTTIYRP